MDLPVENAQAVSDIFRRILTDILEELVDKVPDGYQSNTDVIKQSLRNISHLYRNGLRYGSSTWRSDWDDPANRCAYVFLYLMHHCYLVYGSLQHSDEVTRSWRNKSSLKVCSIGGGPGSDLVGLATFLRLHGIFPPSLECLVLDLYPDWEDTWETIYGNLPDTFAVTYRKCDLVNDTARLHARDLQFIKRADILTLSKSFSAVSAFFRNDHTKGALLRNVLQETKAGCFVLYIDNDFSGCAQFQRDFASRAGMDLVFEFRGTPTFPKGPYSHTIRKYHGLFDFSPMRKCDVTIQLFRKKGAVRSGQAVRIESNQSSRGPALGIPGSSRGTTHHDVDSIFNSDNLCAVSNAVTRGRAFPPGTQHSWDIPPATINVERAPPHPIRRPAAAETPPPRSRATPGPAQSTRAPADSGRAHVSSITLQPSRVGYSTPQPKYASRAPHDDDYETPSARNCCPSTCTIL